MPIAEKLIVFLSVPCWLKGQNAPVRIAWSVDEPALHEVMTPYLSATYICRAMPICRRWFLHVVERA